MALNYIITNSPSDITVTGNVGQTFGEISNNPYILKTITPLPGYQVNRTLFTVSGAQPGNTNDQLESSHWYQGDSGVILPSYVTEVEIKDVPIDDGGLLAGQTIMKVFLDPNFVIPPGWGDNYDIIIDLDGDAELIPSPQPPECFTITVEMALGEDSNCEMYGWAVRGNPNNIQPPVPYSQQWQDDTYGPISPLEENNEHFSAELNFGFIGGDIGQGINGGGETQPGGGTTFVTRFCPGDEYSVGNTLMTPESFDTWIWIKPSSGHKISRHNLAVKTIYNNYQIFSGDPDNPYDQTNDCCIPSLDWWNNNFPTYETWQYTKIYQSTYTEFNWAENWSEGVAEGFVNYATNALLGVPVQPMSENNFTDVTYDDGSIGEGVIPVFDASNPAGTQNMYHESIWRPWSKNSNDTPSPLTSWPMTCPNGVCSPKMHAATIYENAEILVRDNNNNYGSYWGDGVHHINNFSTFVPDGKIILYDWAGTCTPWSYQQFANNNVDSNGVPTTTGPISDMASSISISSGSCGLAEAWTYGYEWIDGGFPYSTETAILPAGSCVSDYDGNAVLLKLHGIQNLVPSNGLNDIRIIIYGAAMPTDGEDCVDYDITINAD
tara:strand:- start:3553 stop:5370 length:1818 start_codon:yes stop_codon:yes gene_type:complete